MMEAAAVFTLIKLVPAHLFGRNTSVESLARCGSQCDLCPVLGDFGFIRKNQVKMFYLVC